MWHEWQTVKRTESGVGFVCFFFVCELKNISEVNYVTGEKKLCRPRWYDPAVYCLHASICYLIHTCQFFINCLIINSLLNWFNKLDFFVALVKAKMWRLTFDYDIWVSRVTDPPEKPLISVCDWHTCSRSTLKPSPTLQQCLHPTPAKCGQHTVCSVCLSPCHGTIIRPTAWALCWGWWIKLTDIIDQCSPSAMLRNKDIITFIGRFTHFLHLPIFFFLQILCLINVVKLTMNTLLSMKP